MFSQQYATTGRRVRPRRVDMINAQTPHIQDSMALADAKKHQAAMQRISEQGLALTEDQIKEQEKQNKKANYLAGGNLLLTSYLKNRGNEAIGDVMDASAATPEVAGAADLTDMAGSSPEMSEFSGAMADPSTGSNLWDTGSEYLSDFGSRLMQPSTLLGGGIGGMVGQNWKSKNKWTRAGAGAVAGAGSQWLLGGGLKNLITGAGTTDWYSSAISGAMGGLLSFL